MTNSRQLTNGDSLRFYSFLSRFQRPKSYLGKIMLTAFVGTHIPLLALVIYAVSSSTWNPELKIRILLIALVATLVGAGLTLWVLQKLLRPITMTYRGLRQYLEKNVIPDLPVDFTDEAGILMADTKFAITKLDVSIHQLKNYDSLTALPNRMLFQNRLGQALAQARRKNESLAVMVVDLDGFGDINEAHGQEQGDSLLRQTAQRLGASIRDDDMLARISSDEFAILHADLTSLEEIAAHSERILRALDRPFSVKDGEIYMSASIGIAIYPTDKSGTEQLLTDANAAMRLAKQRGRKTFGFFSPELNETLRTRLVLESDLRLALEREELVLFYQPQIDLRSGKFTGAEALLRWKHPQRGLVPPNEFIPVAEASGLIEPIGEWVLRAACLRSKTWQAAGLPHIRMAVNLSTRQFQQADLIDIVTSTLKQTALDASELELEITESLIMEDVQRAVVVLDDLHKLGVTVALDDFGTGYSSLNYLKRFPIDSLKIDRAFVSGLPGDANDVAISQSIIALARSLHLDVIAEGVETKEQVEFLQQNGCQRMQGFYFGRPVPAEEFVRLWEQWGK